MDLRNKELVDGGHAMALDFTDREVKVDPKPKAFVPVYQYRNVHWNHLGWVDITMEDRETLKSIATALPGDYQFRTLYRGWE